MVIIFTGDGKGKTSAALGTVIRLSPVMPKHQDASSLLGFAEEQVEGERREIRTPQHLGNQVKAARIPLDPAHHRLELLVKTSRKLRPAFFFVIG